MAGHILIVGAGPAGLALARALADSRHHVTLIERQPMAALAEPARDGRDIALTHRSIRTLRDLGVWPLIPSEEIFPLREARVLNGGSSFALSIAPGDAGDAPLGMLVSNHLIRGALFVGVAGQRNVTICAGVAVEDVRASAAGAEVQLSNGERLAGDLIVAADARRSATRDRLGIAAEVTPLGRTMLVCRVKHARPHEGIATEWFDHGRTIAMLPLEPHRSSLILTLPDAEAAALAGLPAEALEPAFRLYTAGRWGAIAAEQPPFAYPLTLAYAARFAAARAALVGDAAVGMHPVTAHGFNFGLMGAVRLGQSIAGAADPGDARLLARYAAVHRAATWPLYQATNMLVRLFTDERPPARLARRAALRLGALPPARRGIGRLLMRNALT